MDDSDLSQALSSVWIRPRPPSQNEDDPGLVSAAALFERVRLAPDQCNQCHYLTTQRNELALELQDFQRQLQQLRQQSQDREQALRERVEQLSSELSRSQDSVSQLRNNLEETVSRNTEIERELQTSHANVVRLERELTDERDRYRALAHTAQQPSTAIESVNLQQFRDLCRPGWIVDRRELIVSDEVIGTGAYGSVRSGFWRACPVAVKAIHGVIMSEYNRRLFEREMYLYSLLSHPHLLKCYGACTDDNHVCDENSFIIFDSAKS